MTDALRAAVEAADAAGQEVADAWNARATFNERVMAMSQLKAAIRAAVNEAANWGHHFGDYKTTAERDVALAAALGESR